MEPKLQPNSAFAASSVALGLSGRYATALFDLAIDGNALDAVAASLATLKDALAQSDDLKALVSSPMVGRKAAAAGVAAVAGALGLDKLTTIVPRRARRATAVSRCCPPSSVISTRWLRPAAAKSARGSPLPTRSPPTQQTALAAKLKAGLGRDVALDITVDPAILGGLVVRVGSRMIDSSLKTRLDSLGQALKG